MWFQTQRLRKAAEIGAALASRFVTTRQVQRFLSEVECEARPLQLGMFRRARLATSFKCQLLDKGVETDFANELTRLLLLRLSSPQATASDEAALMTSAARPKARNIQSLLMQADAAAARGDHAAASGLFAQVLAIRPGHPFACNNLGVALHKLHRYAESEAQFRHAVRAQPTYHDGLKNLGNSLRMRGQFAESETSLRRALKTRPHDADTLCAMGQTLVFLNRLGDARRCFDSALKVAAGHPASLCGLAQIAGLEGRFDDADALYRRALQTDPNLPTAWAALAGLRKMSYADHAWLNTAETLAAADLAPLEEAELRFAMGKFHDDVGNFAKAFRNFERANQLQKSTATPYDRAARSLFVDGMIRGCPAGEVLGPQAGSSDSARPVFVVGMMRSGTSLIEQIIASHPSAAGAGELPFWSDAARRHPEALHAAGLNAPLRRKLAQAYLNTLHAQPAQALRVVDKSTYNVDYLGLIHSVFPNARILYVRRDPLDVCLSCYFNQLSPTHEFAMDLGDLAHYYREHQLMMAHWTSVLPAGILLEIQYADLVGEQERWTRRILEFIGLEWDERCLDSHTAARPVLTASFWQVRQKMYRTFGGAVAQLPELHRPDPRAAHAGGILTLIRARGTNDWRPG